MNLSRLVICPALAMLRNVERAEAVTWGVNACPFSPLAVSVILSLVPLLRQ